MALPLPIFAAGRCLSRSLALGSGSVGPTSAGLWRNGLGLFALPLPVFGAWGCALHQKRYPTTQQPNRGPRAPRAPRASPGPHRGWFFPTPVARAAAFLAGGWASPHVTLCPPNGETRGTREKIVFLYTEINVTTDSVVFPYKKHQS